jgi:FSR family fosmidomycin resistance protein-like MFS transporter
LTVDEPVDAAPDGPAPDGPAPEFDRSTVGLMSLAHFVHDTYPAFIGVLLPLLIERLSLTLAAAGLLASGIRWTTMLQPLLGYLADRTDARYFIVVTPAITAVCISLVGIAPGFAAVFALLLLSGISHATFHPAAASLVTRAAGARWGKGASYFMTGGELGRAIGPLYIAAVLTAVGIDWSWIALVPGVLVSLVLYGRLRQRHADRYISPAGHVRTAFRGNRRPVMLLSAAIALRSVANTALVTFLPTLLVANGSDLVYAGLTIAVYEIGGTAGAFTGGTISDRVGRRGVLAVSLAAGLPAMALALVAPTGPWQLAILAVAGFGLLSAMPVQLVTMHELFPDNRAMATGITYFTGTGGGIVALIALGVLADAIGLQAALLAGVVISAFGMIAILALPRITAPPAAGPAGTLAG